MKPILQGNNALSQTVSGEKAQHTAKLSDLMNRELIEGHTQALIGMEKADLVEIVAAIIVDVEETHRLADELLGFATLVLVKAWHCGCLLNFAKEQHEHGEFEKWFHKTFPEHFLRLRTAQRYMKLAYTYTRLNDLIVSNSSLRQAYITCGILPEPPESEGPANKDRESAARVGLLKSVASVQTRLRRFSTRKVSLDDRTKKELVSAKAEIDELFKGLLD